MARPKKIIFGGDTYTLYATAQSRDKADQDKRILKKRGYSSIRIIKLGGGYKQLPRWEVWAKR